MSYRIGSFNCHNFKNFDSRDLQCFADIISKEKFDIVALQEIHGDYALQSILSRLGKKWAGVADNSVNDYAFIWNTRRVELANAKEAGKDRVYQPRIYKQYKIDRKNGQTDLIREPFFARFFPVGGAAPYIEIRLINTHIRFSKGSDNDDAENSPSAIAMRKKEFEVLVKSIYAKEAYNKTYGTSRPHYAILLGDYNLNHPDSPAKSPFLQETFEIMDGPQKRVITTIQTELTTLKKVKPEETGDNNKEHYANNYDHFTYDEGLFNNVFISSSRVEAVEKYCKNDYEKYAKEVSDHLPVKMNINIRG